MDMTGSRSRTTGIGMRVAQRSDTVTGFHSPAPTNVRSRPAPALANMAAASRHWEGDASADGLTAIIFCNQTHSIQADAKNPMPTPLRPIRAPNFSCHATMTNTSSEEALQIRITA